ncbi:Uncharacterised protein [Mycobacteroides abscessus subsp. abscessus]|nr:Uncharacterised protein [Mycobacteroides abscessus subsp. abscessus]
MITNTMIGPTHQNTSHPVRNTSCDGSNALAGAINPRTHRWRLGSGTVADLPSVCTFAPLKEPLTPMYENTYRVEGRYTAPSR